MLGVVLACGTGVVAAGVAVWWAGPVVGVVVFVGHVLYERVRPGPVTGWRQGAVAERRTGKRLSRLDPAGFHVLHDRAVPGVPATNLDHLVVGLTGVYAILSRRWSWGTRLRVDVGRLWVGKRPVGELSGAVSRTAGTVAELLADELDYDVRVMPVVAVHGAHVPRYGVQHGGVDFQSYRALPRAVSDEPVIFTSAQVATIAAAAERLLPPMLEMLSPE
ncbi:nuclease-related domain-containing protein [Spirillospora sp. CA-294931]|uniref:nuclease-related domain-containing protein n=1 Tax=Spirillospora sp. CA-294931 TaxID=3240042 RepID=UPI003D93BEEA